MTEIEKTVFDLIRAAASDLSYEIGETVDPAALYRIVRRQHLSAFLWKYASRLPDSPVRRAWERDRDLSALKELTYREEKEKIDRALSEAGIRFLYLKGTVLKNLWDDPSFRYMGDADFLYEGDDGALHRAFGELGYSAESYGTRDFSHHFVFHKDPWFSVEPHFALFDADSPFAGKLTDLFDRATPDPELPGRFLISEEDLYLHTLLHARKHIANGGIGVRSFLDFVFLLRAYPDLRERERVRAFVADGGLGPFEARFLRIVSLFSDPASTPDAEDEEELSALFSAGLFGSTERSFGNQLETESKRSRFPRLRFLFKRAFPPLLSMAHRKFRAPLSWIVYPYYWLRRVFAMLFSRNRRNNTKASLQAVACFKENRDVMGRELRYFGISPEEETGEEARRD